MKRSWLTVRLSRHSSTACAALAEMYTSLYIVICEVDADESSGKDPAVTRDASIFECEGVNPAGHRKTGLSRPRSSRILVLYVYYIYLHLKTWGISPVTGPEPPFPGVLRLPHFTSSDLRLQPFRNSPSFTTH